MTITTRVVIGFRIPDEIPAAIRFEQENDMREWHKLNTTERICYVKNTTCVCGREAE